jgi:hypothetical protein
MIPHVKEATRRAVGLDGALQQCLHALEGLGWPLGYTFLRAYEQQTTDVTGEGRTQPFVHTGQGQYYNALPNDAMPCTVFFRTDGPEVVGLNKDGGKYRQPLSERPVSLVFWGDLLKIGASYKADYPYTELIKEDFIKVLAPLSCVKEITSYRDEPFGEVFEGYELTNQQRALCRFPLACFRLDFTVTYRAQC